MSFLEAILSGNNAQETKKKQICAIAIAATAVLLVICIIAFAICQVVDITSNLTNKEKDTGEIEDSIDFGETTSIELSETQIYSGNLLTLNDDNHYKGEPELINIEDARDEHGAFISLFGNKNFFEATPKTAQALFDMVVDCNKALAEDGSDDDNLVLSGAYNVNEISTQKGVYSSGEAVAISCCYEGSTQDIRPINEVPKYKWIYNNAHKYGFVPVSANSNVFRYVGVQHATAARSNGTYLNTYLKKLKNATVEAPLTLDANGTSVAYYCPINDVKVPKNYDYDISGDNVGGVIITVNLSKPSQNSGNGSINDVEAIG